jgi:hypothetical protein
VARSKIHSFFFVGCMHLLCFFLQENDASAARGRIRNLSLCTEQNYSPLQIDARTNDEVGMFSLMES